MTRMLTSVDLVDPKSLTETHLSSCLSRCIIPKVGQSSLEVWLGAVMSGKFDSKYCEGYPYENDPLARRTKWTVDAYSTFGPFGLYWNQGGEVNFNLSLPVYQKRIYSFTIDVGCAVGANPYNLPITEEIITLGKASLTLVHQLRNPSGRLPDRTSPNSYMLIENGFNWDNTKLALEIYNLTHDPFIERTELSSVTLKDSTTTTYVLSDETKGPTGVILFTKSRAGLVHTEFYPSNITTWFVPICDPSGDPVFHEGTFHALITAKFGLGMIYNHVFGKGERDLNTFNTYYCLYPYGGFGLESINLMSYKIPSLRKDKFLADPWNSSQ